jgi:DNA-binding NarL/FixJ family response regulator
MKKINIAIVDDHSLFLEGLSSILKDIENFNILITASSAKELLNQPNLATIDVLVSDISMPEIDGIALSQMIKKQFPSIKILILSISVAQGTPFFSEAIKNKIIFMNEVGIESTTKAILPKLSTREKEVLDLIAKGLTINQIAETLFISQHTVVSHKQKLFYKFNVDKITSLVKKAIDLEFID